MKKAELNKLISDGMKLDDIIDNNCEDFYTIIDRKSLLEFVVFNIYEDRLFFARHILNAVDANYADWYSYDTNMGTLETPTAIDSVDDLYDYVED